MKDSEYLSTGMNAIFSEFEKDFELNEMNLKEKALASPGLKTKWVQKFCIESSKLGKLKTAKEKKTFEYTQKHGHVGIPKYVTESEILKSDEIKRIDNAIEEQQNIVRFIDTLLKTVVKDYGFDIRNSTDLTKLENQ